MKEQKHNYYTNSLFIYLLSVFPYLGVTGSGRELSTMEGRTSLDIYRDFLSSIKIFLSLTLIISNFFLPWRLSLSLKGTKEYPSISDNFHCQLV